MRQVLTRLVPIALALLAVVPFAASRTDAAPAGYRIRNRATGQCLVVRGRSEGAWVTTTPCGSYPDQYWQRLYPEVDNFSLIKNTNSGKCLVTRSSGPTRDQAIQSACNREYEDQSWRQVGSNADFHLQNWSTGRCLAKQAASRLATGVACGNHADQRWSYIG
jgi:hypothetical protein